MTTVNLGKVALKIRSIYSDSNSYDIGDIVRYHGDAFICIKRTNPTVDPSYKLRPLITPYAIDDVYDLPTLDYPGSEIKSKPQAYIRHYLLSSGKTQDDGGNTLRNNFTNLVFGGNHKGHMLNTEYWEYMGTGVVDYSIRDRNDVNNDGDGGWNGTTNNSDAYSENALLFTQGGIFLRQGKSSNLNYDEHPYDNHYGQWRCLHNGDMIPRERAVIQLDGSPPPGWKGHPNPAVKLPNWGNTAYKWFGNIPRNIPNEAKRGEYNWRSTGSASYAASYAFITWDGNAIQQSGHNGQNELGPFTHEGGFLGGYKAVTQKDFWDAYTIETSTYGWGKDYKDKRKKSRETYPGYYGIDDFGTISPPNNDGSFWGGLSSQSAEYEYSTTRHSNHFKDYLLEPYGSKPRPIQIEWWGYESMMTLMTDGSIYARGYNGYHAYGTDHGTNYAFGSHLGRDVFNGKRIVKLAGSGWDSANSAGHGMALDEDGEIWTWGYNGYGQCGGTNPTGASQPSYGGYYNGVHENFRNPTKLASNIFFGGAKIVDIWAAGGQYGYNVALDTNGYLWSWGYNGYGQLGYPTNSGFANTDRSQNPKRLEINWSSYAGIQKVVLGGQESYGHFYVLDGQGYMWSCGYNGFGELGTGNTTATGNAGSLTRRTSSNQLAGSIYNIWFTGGQKNILWARHSNGNLYGMGRSSAYDLTSTTSNQYNFVLQNNVSNPYKVVYTGRENGVTSMCLTGSYDVYGTGWNGYGEMGYGDTGNHNDNRNRQQPNGANRWGWQRAAMPSPLTRKIRDIQGNSYYDTTISHQNVILMRTAKGEMLTTGRGYWWSTGLSNNNHYHPMAHGLWGS